jgi:hypothetical protein
VGPEIKIGVLLGRCPAGRQVLDTLVWVVVPPGMPLRGPDMSEDLRLFAASDEAADSDVSESMAVGLSVSLAREGATDAAKTAAYEAPTPDAPRCWLLVAASSPVAELTGWGANPASGAGRLAAGSEKSPEPDGSEALRLAASWRVLDATPGVVLRIPAVTVVFLRRVGAANLSCLRKAEEGFIVERAFRKATSSCLSMLPRQELAPLPSTDIGRCAQANRCTPSSSVCSLAL